MVQRLVAVQFSRFMTSGRTSPALCGCEDETGEAKGEYVVKLRGSIQDRGLLNELLGARLASHFGLLSPLPALVTMDGSFTELIAGIDSAKADVVRASAGLNFGTKALIGYNTWPVDKHIPESLWSTAVKIFAFDALLQNPDRRYANPNLLTRGDEIMVFDHEVAFSFLLDIFPSTEPWLLAEQTYLEQHVFFRQLKSQEIDLEEFTERLKNLSDQALDDMFADVPVEWKNDNEARIDSHLSTIRDHAEEFAEQIRRFLV